MAQQEEKNFHFAEFQVTVRGDVFTVVPNGFGSAVYDPDGDILFNTPWGLDERQATSMVSIWLTAFDDGVKVGKHQKAREVRQVLDL